VDSNLELGLILSLFFLPLAFWMRLLFSVLTVPLLRLFRDALELLFFDRTLPSESLSTVSLRIAIEIFPPLVRESPSTMPLLFAF
jgi:hypothetical protein